MRLAYRGIGRVQSNVHVYTLGWLQAQGRGRTLLPAGFMFTFRFYLSEPRQVFDFVFMLKFSRGLRQLTRLLA